MRKVKFATPLLDAPSGKKIDLLQVDEIVEETANKKDRFVEVKTRNGKQGWVDEAELQSLDAAERVPVDEDLFVDSCIAIELDFNNQESTAPWFVRADFLITRALIMTEIKNVGPKIPHLDAVGPLQVSTDEWSKFLNSGGALAANFHPGDNDHHIKQIRGAAFRMHSDARAISEAVTADLRDAGRPSDEPYQPNSIDLILVLILGTHWGSRFVCARVVNGGDTLLSDVLDKPDDDRDAAMRAYPDLFAVPGDDPLTLDAVYDNIADKVDNALEKAAERIAAAAPEEVVQRNEDEGAEPRDVLTPVQKIDWATATDAQPTIIEKMKDIYAAFRHAGFSDAGARALLAEVGRENDYRPAFLFGAHTDPANKARNAGMLSWQKSRANDLMEFLRAHDVLMANGAMRRDQASLNAQAAFILQEMRGKENKPDLAKYLTDATQKVDYELAAKRLGREYIRWRFDDSALASHHRKRRRFLELSFKAIDAGGLTATGQAGNAVDIKVTKGKDGFHQAAGLIYDVKGKIRNKPVSEKYVRQLMSAVVATDPALAVRIHSAGQDPRGTPGGRRTGSTRHDINKATREGETADMALIKDGQLVLPEEDPELYEKFLEHAAALGFPGIGHYNWGVHIGAGGVAAWGPNGSSTSLDPRFRAAIARGRDRFK